MKARHLGTLGMYHVGRRPILHTPPAVLHRLGAGLARRYFAFESRYVRYALVNLRVAYPELPEEERRALCRSSFVHFAWNALDWVRSQRWSAADFRARIAVDGIEEIERSRKNGNGVLVLTGHVGNFEFAGQALALGGVRMTVIGRQMRNRRLYAHIQRERTRFGNEVVDRLGAAAEISRVLRQGGIVGIVNDQYVRRHHGILAPFLGPRCWTSPGVAAIALRRGTPVHPFFIVRDGPDHHTMRILPPVALETTGDHPYDVQAATARLNGVLESGIRAHPEQWLWPHRRFRHSPDLPPDLYEPTTALERTAVATG